MNVKPLPFSIALAGILAVPLAFIFSAANARPVLATGRAAPSTASGWDPQAAARYLDGRELWWQGWDGARKDHGTVCVSCHMQAPYALGRPALRSALGEQNPSAQEEAMLASIQKRVHLWKDVLPFYSDAVYGAGKGAQSRAAESVLNAIILARYDARQGRGSQTAAMAFDDAWALQLQSGPDAGAWNWQNFDYGPWESKESQYYWAAQMAMAASQEPGREKLAPPSAGKPPAISASGPNGASNLALLLSYLRSHYEAQPLMNQIMALWAGRFFPSLITEGQSRTLLGNLKRLQHPDGGWSLTDLGAWKRKDQTPLETRSDGYATGLIVLALEETATNSAAEPLLSGGIGWLKANQDKTTGAWPAWSVNKERNPKSIAAQFMSDAATGYAVMALEAHP